MIAGIGIDIVEIDRVRKSCERESFLKKCYTEAEREMANGNPAFLAGNFAVKEAVAKALGTGFRGFGPSEIEVLRDALGKPVVKLYGEAKKQETALAITNWFVSISDTAATACAAAVAETGGMNVPL